MKKSVGLLLAAGAVGAALAISPAAHADAAWVVAANSPSHEQMEFAWGIDQAAAESRALAQCARIERASDCQVLASGPDCVAIAWDAADPINHAHGVSGGGRDVVVPAAIAAAGPHANDAQSRCSWDPHA
jgi:hypothetical protein